MNLSNTTLCSLSIYYQNVRGLRTKTHDFFCNLSRTRYDLIILTETWLNCGILSTELFDDNYVVFRRDREESRTMTKKEGGGVLIAVSKSIRSKRQFSFETDNEDLWVTIDLGTPLKPFFIAFCAVYLPPPVLRSTLQTFIDNVSNINEQNTCHKCIVGDFNLSNINWELVKNLTLITLLHLTTTFWIFLT